MNEWQRNHINEHSSEDLWKNTGEKAKHAHARMKPLMFLYKNDIAVKISL